MDTDPGGKAPDATVARALGALKREGSNVLLVGGDATGHGVACERFVGEAGDDRRYQLLVTTTPSPAPAVFAGGCEDADGVITYPRADGDASFDALAALGAEIVETVDAFDGEAAGFDPSQLRLCLDSLEPLLAAHDAERIFRLLHVVTARVRRASGMGHYHLPVERDHDDVRLLEPLFDAILELRTRDDRIEQRWHLRDHETSSRWLSLE